MRSRIARLFLIPALAFAASILVSAQSAPTASPKASAASIKRGEYLVRIGGCGDCHTPLKLGPNGPEPDMARALTGHPSQMAMPPAPAGAGPWMWTGAATNTAFAGPWGVSFTANLTPDKETGLGEWTFDMFAATMRTGRHQGKGRPILPPMPYPNVAAMTESDMRDLFNYLQSLPPVHNKVPSPVDPPEETR